jgi:protein gp37
VKDSKIAWTHSTFNPWWGCFKVSAECTKCYANTFAKRTGHDVWGLQARRRFFNPSEKEAAAGLEAAHWREPLKWNARAKAHGQQHRVFCASMADVFEQLPDGHPDTERMAAERLRLWSLIDATPHLTWLLLTKRPENIMRMIPAASWSFKPPMPWPNVWLGTSVGAQETKWRIDELRRVPAAVHFISAEPLLEDLGDLDLSHIEWLICGGESGAGARPFDIQWAHKLRQQCEAAGTAFFMKQLGENAIVGESAPESSRGRWRTSNKKGEDIAEFPQSLQVRQYPEARP